MLIEHIQAIDPQLRREITPLRNQKLWACVMSSVKPSIGAYRTHRMPLVYCGRQSLPIRRRFCSHISWLYLRSEGDAINIVKLLPRITILWINKGITHKGTKPLPLNLMFWVCWASQDALYFPVASKVILLKNTHKQAGTKGATPWIKTMQNEIRPPNRVKRITRDGDSEVETIFTKTAQSQLLKNFYSSIFREDEARPTSTRPVPTAVMPMPQFSIPVVHTKLSSLSKGCGPYEIHPQMVRWLADFLAKPLSKLFANSPTMAVVPTDWRLEITCPIHKNGDSEDV